MRQFFKKNYITIFNTLFVTFASVFLTFYFLDLWNYDFQVPLFYADGDCLFTCRQIKSLGEYGSYLINPLMGAPFGATMYDYPLYGDSFHHLIILILYAIFNNYGVVINVFYILLFPATTIISYFVMRNLKVSQFFSDIGSLTFSFLPYRFLRGQMHLFLSAYTFIPLSILILLWLITDNKLLACEKGFFKYKRNYIALISLVIIALSGIYYAFFMCFFLALTILIIFCKSQKYRTIKTFLKGVISIGTIGISIVLSAIPTYLGLLKYGASTESTVRLPIEAEINGFKIVLLFLPIRDHGIEFFKKLLAKYSTAPLVAENRDAYLGFLCIIGFVFLIFLIFYKFKKENELNSQLDLLAKLNIGSILLATIGGGGVIFSLLVSPQIRAYNRISIFIAYFSILSLCMGLTSLFSRWKPRIRQIATIAVVPLFLLGLYEQTTHYYDHSAVISSYYSDDNFVKNIESTVGSDSTIFQLPYLKFPESESINRMGDYGLTRGYLHSDTLKWSYGDYKGRESDLWNRNVSSKPTTEMIETLSFAGFSGIYIDTFAYTPDELQSLKDEIEDVLHESLLVSDDGRLIFYSMVNYNTELKSMYSSDEWNVKSDEALEVPVS